MTPQDKPITKNKVSLSLDLRLVCLLLLVVIGVMLLYWKPWQTNGNTQRKVTISGEATIKSEPDEFQFNPYYEKDTTVEATILNKQIIAKLKELGVNEAQIKNNASSYGSPDVYYMMPVEGKEKTTLNLTVTVSNKELAQKVQDYLLTTNPKGSVTPYPSFSTSKQKELTDKARDEAIADAKKRADKTAAGLDAKIGKVLEVSESRSAGIYPMMGSTSDVSSNESTKQSLSIQPGENEFSYSVQLVFELK
jgi:uncharacterized protein YggE